MTFVFVLFFVVCRISGTNCKKVLTIQAFLCESQRTAQSVATCFSLLITAKCLKSQECTIELSMRSHNRAEKHSVGIVHLRVSDLSILFVYAKITWEFLNTIRICTCSMLICYIVRCAFSSNNNRRRSGITSWTRICKSVVVVAAFLPNRCWSLDHSLVVIVSAGQPPRRRPRATRIQTPSCLCRCVDNFTLCRT